jgi:hypothetical protein
LIIFKLEAEEEEMATYYPTTSNQSDVLPTQYLPSAEKSDPVYHDNMMYINQDSYSHYYGVDIPCGDENRGEMVFFPPTTEPIITQENFQYQELSLSLGMQNPSTFNMPSFQFNNYASSCPSYSLTSQVPDPGDCGSQKGESSSFDTFRIGAMNNQSHCSIFNSRYVKATQQLLGELVNVHEALKQPKLEKHLDQDIAKEVGEISADERKNLQSKMTKLSAMLDEVDRRYNQYSSQMKVVEASFEMIAGSGAAKSYTRLALRTISCHFRCLRDAICKHIQMTSRSLGEKDDDALNTRLLPRLRYVDKKIRQQKNIGVLQHSWRPQRGLPENSVSILRAWLFEHFLHPYPKDSEKIMLARQTGLTRSQVANWFINARVRLWKPMVEDMYKEEFGADSEIECKTSPKEDVSREIGDKSWTVDDNMYYTMRNFNGIQQTDGNDDHKVCEDEGRPINNVCELVSFEVENGVSLAL